MLVSHSDAFHVRLEPEILLNLRFSHSFRWATDSVSQNPTELLGLAAGATNEFRKNDGLVQLVEKNTITLLPRLRRSSASIFDDWNFRSRTIRRRENSVLILWNAHGPISVSSVTFSYCKIERFIVVVFIYKSIDKARSTYPQRVVLNAVRSTVRSSSTQPVTPRNRNSRRLVEFSKSAIRLFPLIFIYVFPAGSAATVKPSRWRVKTEQSRPASTKLTNITGPKNDRCSGFLVFHMHILPALLAGDEILFIDSEPFYFRNRSLKPISNYDHRFSIMNDYCRCSHNMYKSNELLLTVN